MSEKSDEKQDIKKDMIEVNKDTHSSEENSSYDSDEIEEEAEKISVSKEFEENVVKYVKLDNLIRKKWQKLKN